MFDFVLVGGGLANGLNALALLDARPDLRLALVEREPRLGGNHTWCFHAADLSPAARRWAEPLLVHRWPGYAVRFPRLGRVLDQPYAAITSERLHEVVGRALAEAPRAELMCSMAAERVAADGVRLADGRRLAAGCVVDARGPEAAAAPRGCGWQKFLGQELRTSADHGIARPLVMDAAVAQTDGYRFIYALPFGPRRLLVEDTFFADGPQLDAAAARAGIAAWLAERGLHTEAVLREERGCLPMPWTAPAPPAAGGPIAAGMQGGWFHPGTGYSLPAAARLAELLAEWAPRPPVAAALGACWRALERQAGFARLLNRMLFNWIPPRQRWKILERFHRLDAAAISRYYGLRLRWADRARILIDRPPGARWLRLPGAARRVESGRTDAG